MSFFKKKKHVSPQTLDGIIAGLNQAANKASDLSLDHYSNMIDQYFERDEESELYRPKTLGLQVDDDHVINFPLICVSDAKGIFLDEFEVDFSVKVIGNTDYEELKKDLNKDGSGIVVDLAPRRSKKEKRDNDIIDIKAKFKSSEAPESVMRVIDHFNSNVIAEQTISAKLNKLAGEHDSYGADIFKNKIFEFKKESMAVDHIEKSLELLMQLNDLEGRDKGSKTESFEEQLKRAQIRQLKAKYEMEKAEYEYEVALLKKGGDVY